MKESDSQPWGQNPNMGLQDKSQELQDNYQMGTRQKMFAMQNDYFLTSTELQGFFSL